jgi:hypothetical protein
MRLRSLLTLLLAVCALFAAEAALAQKPAGKKPVEPPPDYFPLRAGHWWKYSFAAGNATKGEFTVKVAGDEKQADGSTLYLVETESTLPIRDWYSKPEGWVLVHRQEYPKNSMKAEFQPVRQYLKNPLGAGATWEWKGKGMMNVDISESSRVEGAEEVVVPAGRFKAMKVVTKVVQGGTPVTKTYWFANHVGLVKSMTDTGSVQSTAELVDYSFKPK